MAPTFEWTRRYETGLTEVDRQHRGLVDLINAMGELVADGVEPDEGLLGDLTDRLKDYAVYHFTEEEDLMAASGMDARHLDHHRRQHQYFVDELERLDRDADSPAAVGFMLEFLTAWLTYHILGTDQAMARQLAAIDGGLSAAHAFAADEAGQAQAGGAEPLLAALHKLFHQVSERNLQLKTLNETLEQRVAERTAALSEAVARLEAEKGESQRLGAALAAANRHLEALAMTDVLTGLPNRRHALASLDRLWREAAAGDLPLALVMIDLDGFKPVNDRYGHDAGDAVLVAFARELERLVRTDDVACRMGGDEFLVICPHTTAAGAERVAATVRQRMSGLRLAVGGGEWQGSISAGVAERRAGTAGVTELLKAADEAVYAAKAAGRCCVRVAD